MSNGIAIVPERRGKTVCDWCRADGVILGPGEYPPLTAMKCSKCHHEWDAVLSGREIREVKARTP
jgi:hypothetical protein